MNRVRTTVVVSALAYGLSGLSPTAQQSLVQVPTGRLTFGMFAGRFNADGTFSIEGKDWPALQGTWKASGSQIDLTPVVKGVCDVAGNNGVFDAYDVKTGAELYRQRMPEIGSGFSASPVAADGKLYVSSEDGERFVIGAGRAFKHIATNSIGELLMATPALSEGVMYVRSSQSVFAIGRKRQP